MAEFTLDDIGYADIPEAPKNGPSSLEDMGYDVRNAETGEKIRTPEERGMTPEEAEAVDDYINSLPDQRSWSQIGADTWNNIKSGVSYFAPTALGGEGKFRLSDMPSAIGTGVVEGVKAPYRLASGEVPMFDASGMPREQAIKEAFKFDSLYMPNELGLTSRAAIRNMPIVERAARRRIADAIAADERQGTIRGVDPNSRTQYGPRALPGATPEQLAALAAEGVPVSGYDLSGGTNLKRLVENSSEKAHNTGPATALQQEIASRSAGGNQYVASTIDDIAGRQIQTGDEFKAAVDAIKDTNSANYPAVMGMPEHQQVFSPALKTILEERPIFRDILREQAQNLENKGQFPPPIYGPNGQLNILPANAPSLEFLNDVYIVAREKASKAFEAGDNTAGKGYKDAANALRSELDNLSVKDANGNSVYKSIRDDASAVFGAKNALEAGYKYITQSNPLKMDEINRAIAGYTPDQIHQLQTGLLARMKDEVLKPNGLAKVTSYFDGSNPQMYNKISRVLGTDVADRLGNQMRLQKIVNETKAPVLSPEAAAKTGGISPSAAAGIGAVGALALEKTMENIPSIMNAASGPVSGTVMAGAAAATTLYGLKKLIGSAKNAYEARVAQSVLEAVTTRDPAAFAALERMPPGAVRYVLDQVTRRFPNVAVGAAGGSGNQSKDDVVITERPGRKSGGRVGVNPISAEVKRVRALLAEKTASMLSVPDDAIATALHIAKRT